MWHAKETQREGGRHQLQGAFSQQVAAPETRRKMTTEQRQANFGELDEFEEHMCRVGNDHYRVMTGRIDWLRSVLHLSGSQLSCHIIRCFHRNQKPSLSIGPLKYTISSIRSQILCKLQLGTVPVKQSKQLLKCFQTKIYFHFRKTTINYFTSE